MQTYKSQAEVEERYPQRFKSKAPSLGKRKTIGEDFVESKDTSFWNFFDVRNRCQYRSTVLADSFEVALLRDDGTKRKIWLGETASGVWRKVLMDVHAAQEKMAKEVGDPTLIRSCNCNCNFQINGCPRFGLEPEWCRVGQETISYETIPPYVRSQKAREQLAKIRKLWKGTSSYTYNVAV